MFEHYYFFFHYCMLSCRYVMFQKRILSKRKWGAQAVVMGARPPGLPVLYHGYTMVNFMVEFNGI